MEGISLHNPGLNTKQDSTQRSNNNNNIKSSTTQYCSGCTTTQHTTHEINKTNTNNSIVQYCTGNNTSEDGTEGINNIVMNNSNTNISSKMISQSRFSSIPRNSKIVPYPDHCCVRSSTSIFKYLNPSTTHTQCKHSKFATRTLSTKILSNQLGTFNSEMLTSIQPVLSTSRQFGDDTLTHVDSKGCASMVGVGAKKDTVRLAVAEGKILLGDKAFSLIKQNKIKKGDVLTVAQLAGIMGAKATPSLIPLCHPILLTNITVNLSLDDEQKAVVVEARTECTGKTGVEMEALTACSVALLTVYDMCKAVNKGMIIQDVQLVAKSGGKSKDYNKEQDNSNQ